MVVDAPQLLADVAHSTKLDISFDPSIIIPLETESLCIFEDGGYVYVVCDKVRKPINWHESNFWAECVEISHPQASVYALKSKNHFCLSLNKQKQIVLCPPFWADQPRAISTIKAQTQTGRITFSGLKPASPVTFQHNKHTFTVVPTLKIDGGYGGRMIAMCPNAILMSIQGLAFRDIDPSTAHTQVQQVIWSNSQVTTELAFCWPKNPHPKLRSAWDLLSKGDVASAMAQLDLAIDADPSLSRLTEAQALRAWIDLCFGRMPSVQNAMHDVRCLFWLDALEPSVCWHDAAWHDVIQHLTELPPFVQKRVYETALSHAHHHVSTEVMKQLMACYRLIVDKESPDLLYVFYDAVYSQLTQSSDVHKKIGIFLQKAQTASSCGSQMWNWAQYWKNPDKAFKEWSPFSPLWEVHLGLEKIFKEQRYREALVAASISSFAPGIDVMITRIMKDSNVSPLEKLSLWNEFTNRCSETTCVSLIDYVIDCWKKLGLPENAVEVMMRQVQGAPREKQDEAYMRIAAYQASNGLWAEAKQSLSHIEHPPCCMMQEYVLLKAEILWREGKKTEALELLKHGTTPDFTKRRAQYLQDLKRYEEASEQWALLMSAKNPEAMEHYAVCLIKIGHTKQLDLWMQTCRDTIEKHPWLLHALQSFQALSQSERVSAIARWEEALATRKEKEM